MFEAQYLNRMKLARMEQNSWIMATDGNRRHS
jgi:hypothetical protein